MVGLTADFEAWLAGQLPLVAADVIEKHKQMAASPVRFLRATYYLWLTRFVDLLPELLDQPDVVAVGDLHAENFGTWRDRPGVRRWGVNDLDELARVSFALDLVRLGTSLALLGDSPMSTRDVCRALVEQWQEAGDRSAIRVDAEAALRELMPAPDPAYFSHLAAAAPADPGTVPSPVRAAVMATVTALWEPTWHTRTAGVGSLGHPRMVAIGRDGHGDWQSREVKQLGPGTAVWLAGRVAGPRLPAPAAELYPRVVEALRGPWPGERAGGWQLRRLAPDVVRVDYPELGRHDLRRVVGFMARSVAAVHAVEPSGLAAARTACDHLGADWLHDAVEVMAADTRAAHHAWRQASR